VAHVLPQEDLKRACAGYQRLLPLFLLRNGARRGRWVRPSCSFAGKLSSNAAALLALVVNVGAYGINANHGWRGQGEGERHAAGRCRYSPNAKGNFTFERVICSWRTGLSVIDLRLKK
jgi:hypothetical protein